MTHYSVDVSIGSLITEVEADDKDAAIDAAIAEWIEDAADIICAGTFSAREIEAPDGDRPV